MGESEFSMWEAEMERPLTLNQQYQPPPLGAPLELWRSHPLFTKAGTKARTLVLTHAENIAYNKGRLAKTVRIKTGQSDWTEDEARAFLRSRCGWTRPAVQLAILEAYEYGRCVPDCKYCGGKSFKELTKQGKEMWRMSLDVFNPRSALPKFGHLTGFRCFDYNRAKAGRCLDEWADYLDEIDREARLKASLASSLDPSLDPILGQVSAATRDHRRKGHKPEPYDQPMFL